MSCPWTQPSWTCWWRWPRATSGARSATRSWRTWSVHCGWAAGVGPGLVRTAPGLEQGGQVAPPPCPAHRGGLWTRGRAWDPLRSWVDRSGGAALGGSVVVYAWAPPPRSAASAQAASSGPSPTDSGHCLGTGCWMSRAWVSTSGSCATWPTRSCPERWTATGISTGTAAARPPCLWPRSPLPRWACLSSQLPRSLPRPWFCLAPALVPPDHCVPVLRGPAQQVGAADLPPRVYEEPPRVPPRPPRSGMALPHVHVHARRVSTPAPIGSGELSPLRWGPGAGSPTVDPTLPFTPVCPPWPGWSSWGSMPSCSS